jgi:hypothetical protein
VANKIGELKDKLYWDCGIIYEPKRPYSLCVFATNTEDKSKENIKNISKIIYDYIHNANTADAKALETPAQDQTTQPNIDSSSPTN